MALPARTGGDAKGGDEPGGLMSPAELRAALKKADTRGKPSSCVVGLTRDKQAVILVDHLPKPRKLLVQVKAQGQASGLDLDVASLRFGRVSVSGKQVDVTVNKAVAPAVELKLKPVMRAAGHPQFTINADPAIEDEPEDAGAADPNGAGGHPSPPAANALPAPGGGAAANGATGPSAAPDGASGAGTPAAVPAAGRGADDLGRLLGGAGRDGSASGSPPAAAAASPLVALRDAAQGIPAAVAADPSRRQSLAALLADARASAEAGDPAAAAPKIEALRQAIAAPAAAPPAAAAPGAPPLAAPAPATAGTGGAAAPSPLVALRDAAQGIPAAVAADPSRRQPLAALLADARASAEAGDPAAAAPKIEALRQAIAAPARPGGGAAGPGAGPAAAQQTPAPSAPTPDDAPGLSAGERMAAMQAGMEQARAGGTRGGVQVADAGPPPGTATDAAGRSGLETPITSPSLLDRVGGFLVDHAPTGRQLYGVAETAAAAGGMVLSGIGVTAGVAQTGAGLLATPAGGAGLPVVASGVALAAGSVALGRESVDLMGRGLDDMFSRPPPAAVPFAPTASPGPPTAPIPPAATGTGPAPGTAPPVQGGQQSSPLPVAPNVQQPAAPPALAAVAAPPTPAAPPLPAAVAAPPAPPALPPLAASPAPPFPTAPPVSAAPPTPASVAVPAAPTIPVAPPVPTAPPIPSMAAPPPPAQGGLASRGLSSARVSPGPLGLPGSTPAGPAAVASTDGAGTTHVRTGGIAAMTAPHPDRVGAAARPAPAPPPMVLPPEGFDIHPGAGEPAGVGTPLPNLGLAPSHTGSLPVPAWQQPVAPPTLGTMPQGVVMSEGSPGIGHNSGEIPQAPTDTSPSDQTGTRVDPAPEESNEKADKERLEKIQRDIDKQKKVLNEEHLEAARRELGGEAVKIDPRTGLPFDHVTEVQSSQQGLKNVIEAIRNALGHPRLDLAQRAELSEKLAQASRLLDHSRKFVP